MKVISQFGSKKVYKTKYNPTFAYNAIISLLNKNGIECFSHGKSRNTNSYYINAANHDDSLVFELRFSDHTKFQDDEEGSYTNFYGNNTLEASILCKDGFKKLKSEILELI